MGVVGGAGISSLSARRIAQTIEVQLAAFGPKLTCGASASGRFSLLIRLAAQPCHSPALPGCF